MKKLYECLLYTLCRGYIHHFGDNYNNYIRKSILDLELKLDNYCSCWLYKILKHII